MQAYFEPEQAFLLSMPQPVFEISIAYKKKNMYTSKIWSTLKLIFTEPNITLLNLISRFKNYL